MSFYPSGNGAVSSVNGQTGIVVLTADDIGALINGDNGALATIGAADIQLNPDATLRQNGVRLPFNPGDLGLAGMHLVVNAAGTGIEWAPV